MIDPIRIAFDVDCPAQHAFAIWTARTSVWWPLTHTVTAQPGLEVVFEPRAGGRIFERTPSGEEHDWGSVVVWEPPLRLVYRWHLRVDRSEATEVEILFRTSDGDRTRVEIEHRGWERLAAAGPARRQSNLAGWGGLLPHYQAATQDHAIRAGL